MSDDKTVTIDGVEYYLDTTIGGLCHGCVTYIGDKSGLCKRLPECQGGVWKVKDKEATR